MNAIDRHNYLATARNKEELEERKQEIREEAEDTKALLAEARRDKDKNLVKELLQIQEEHKEENLYPKEVY